MIFGKTKLEMKVGIFVFFGAVILAVFVLLIGNIRTWTSGQKVRATFNFVNGVKIGAPVRFAGVDVGEVKSLDFIYRTDENRMVIEVIGWIRNDVKIPLDSIVWVNTLGLLGEKYIEIMPGKDFKHFITNGQVLVGKDPISMDELMDTAKGIVDNLNESILKIKNGEGSLGKLLYDDTLYRELESAIKSREGTVGKFFYDDSIYKETEALIQDLRKHPWKLFWKTKEKK